MCSWGGEAGPRQGQQLEGKGQAWFSVAVVIRFEGAVTVHAQVLGLLLNQLGQLHIQLAQVGFSRCFIQLLGQEVDPDRILVWVGPQLNLRQHLVGEGVAHHEAGVAHGTAQVDQPALGQNDDVAPVLQQVAVHLGLDVHPPQCSRSAT